MPKERGQSDRLTVQQKEGQGPITIFHEDAQIHDREVGNTSLFVLKQLEYEFPMLTFRYRKDLSKKEINEALQRKEGKQNEDIHKTRFNKCPSRDSCNGLGTESQAGERRCRRKYT